MEGEEVEASGGPAEHRVAAQTSEAEATAELGEGKHLMEGEGEEGRGGERRRRRAE